MADTEDIPTSPFPSRFDAVIIGGGPAGALTACCLAGAGLEVALVEASDPARLAQPGTDGRSIAVALSAQRVFEGAGAWTFMADEAQPILEIRVTDGASPLFLHYDHTALGDQPFGWIVENTTIRRGLYQRLAQLPKAHVLAPARAQAVDRGAVGATVTLADGRELRTDLVIAADGRPSPTRKGAGIGIRRFDYHQSGIVCTVAHEKPHDGVAHEHFLPSGPFAILPMRGSAEHPHRSSIVWTERLHLADAIVNQDDPGFLDELRTRFGDILGDIALDGPRFHYPLTLQIADRAIDRRLALVGDAAHGMHPVAGQGMNMGVRDVAALVEVMVDARRLGLDVGSPQVLERYQRWRRFDNMLMLGLTDVLVRLFSNDFGPLKLARDLGLAAVQAMPDTKRFFMKHAMGVVGDLPRLMRGERL
ncbi:UbiH/UbiF/VisC/COQ6 family ubiquinone biosynthesis hydroxylase [Magnetospirillum aberrantis]|uniref:UbiH/UbiF/VisC/COQ6 family ubiquinone biosynthesis hydroxylase n=1 Tax=Magnetospirillum aberrantis SpK TaxID=908842 RepID=A0A7C9UY02_9PROT|nr:UbiH/UbiF/VisC/COQ6 family ubiquinone biosynthesis hydroxylase [Magnetospirillum aberrantis]NFV81649.1 UbiH/UbiF/VisC/COQ6 family ubiquinone biosynthesis hydroxylase [Magnetospirillum aberrantis SpK]